MTKIKVGQYVRDTLTNFEGLVYGITEWLNGCRHIGIKPTELDKDGKIQDIQWIDEPQCEVLRKPKIKTKIEKTGGPKENNTRKK